MLERKGFGIRFGAYVIDVVIMTVISMVLLPVVIVTPILGVLLLLAIGFGYPVIEIMTARSPGKMILGMTVMGENGAAATRDQLIRRTLIKFAPSIVGNLIGAVALLVGSPLLSNLANLAALALGITLLVLSWKTLQTTRQAFWDLQVRTAVFGKGVVAQGFAPVMPGQPAPVAGAPVPPPPQG